MGCRLSYGVKEMKYQTTIHNTVIMRIKLSKDDFQEFLSISEKLESGVIEIVQGESVLSGKSLLGLSLIDTSKPQKLIIRGYFDKEYVDNFKKWEVKE